MTAALELVDAPEGRAVGRAVARDGHRPALARERRGRVVAAALAQVAAVGSLDEDLRDTDRAHDDPARGVARLDPACAGAGAEGEPAPESGIRSSARCSAGSSGARPSSSSRSLRRPCWNLA